MWHQMKINQFFFFATDLRNPLESNGGKKETNGTTTKERVFVGQLQLPELKMIMIKLLLSNFNVQGLRKKVVWL